METFSTMWKVLVPVFKYPTRGLSVREIARQSNLSHTSVSRISRELLSEGLIRQEQKGNSMYLVGNFENKEFVRLKRLHNIMVLDTYLEPLLESKFVDLAICFGSYSEGADIESSDIDLYLGYGTYDIPEIQNIEKKAGRKVQIFSGNLKKFPPELKENILNGVKLWGWLELDRL